MSYPLLDVFWTMMWFFLWVLWIFLLIRVFMDIFRSRDLRTPTLQVIVEFLDRPQPIA
jgi:hypothetical protein